MPVSGEVLYERTIVNGPPETLRRSPLGRATKHSDRYDASLLFALPRALQREALGLDRDLPFTGIDIWTAYELTWLDPRGKPAIAIASFEVPCVSPAMVESKSVKRYIGSFAQSQFDSAEHVRSTLARDIGAACGASVSVYLSDPVSGAPAIASLAGVSLDRQSLSVDCYEVDARLLASSAPSVAETLTTELFRSQCPVTGQPDYASVQLTYDGPRIDRAALLRYLVSYRRHAGFHEYCVERIFVDVMVRCACTGLSVYARFTRRGGIDINPFRTNAGIPRPENTRTPRQ